MSETVFDHLETLYTKSKPQELLSKILQPDFQRHQPGDTVFATTERIAGLAKLTSSLTDSDNEAQGIAEAGVSGLAASVAMLVLTQRIDTSRSVVVLAGGLTHNDLYRIQLNKALGTGCGKCYAYRDSSPTRCFRSKVSANSCVSNMH